MTTRLRVPGDPQQAINIMQMSSFRANINIQGGKCRFKPRRVKVWGLKMTKTVRWKKLRRTRLRLRSKQRKGEMNWCSAHKLKHAEWGVSRVNTAFGVGAQCRTRWHLVVMAAARWSRQFRHRFHPIFTERRLVLCGLKANWRWSLRRRRDGETLLKVQLWITMVKTLHTGSDKQPIINNQLVTTANHRNTGVRDVQQILKTSLFLTKWINF